MKYMVSKTEYRDRKYLLIGLIIGALFGIIGNFMSGYYFLGLDHQEEQWKFWFSLVIFVVVIVFSYDTIRRIDKKSK